MKRFPIDYFAITVGLAAMLSVLPCPASAQERAEARAGRGGLPRAVTIEEVRASVPQGVEWIPDVPYREGNPMWTSDVAMSKAKSDKPRAAVVLVHGGGWAAGDKRANPFWRFTLHFAEQGYVTFSINYRLSGEAPFPACVEDVKCAVRWIRANAQKYNIDPNRIGAWGNSAGAHLVSMLGLAGKDAGLEGDGPYQDQSSLVNAVCASAVPSDLTKPGGQMGERLNSAGGLLAGPAESLAERAKKASPIFYVNANAPPFLIIHGTSDATVPLDQAKRLEESLKKVGKKEITAIYIDGGNHAAPVASHQRETLTAVDAFFAKHLGAAK